MVLAAAWYQATLTTLDLLASENSQEYPEERKTSAQWRVGRLAIATDLVDIGGVDMPG
jgi:hypothetical protein